ncbi:MAG TPA: hypothetical protein VMN79_04740 [Casimicrobiaceae bacterium]|nr:hypothetical protein [Casimicrobiaceae bacterium]
MATAKFTPSWVERMPLRRWCAISGEAPDLGLRATERGTRYLVETDPARDARINPARTARERLRRMLGRDPKSPWHGVAGFSAITESWNGAVYASRCGESGTMILYGGGHNNYFGSSVHAFDLATRRWRRLTDGFVAGSAEAYGAGAVYPDAVYPDGSPLPPHTYGYVQYDPVGNDYLLLKGQTELGPNVKAIAIPHLFNLDTLRWRHGPAHPTAILNSGGWTTWDPLRRVLWGHSGDDGGGNAFVGFGPDGIDAGGRCGRWTERFPNKLPGIANHNAMQFDPVRDLIVVAVHARDRLYALDPSEPGGALRRLESEGSKPVLQACAAMDYAPNLAGIAYFSPMDRGTVHLVATTGEDGTGTRDAPWHWRAYSPPADALDPIAHAKARSRYPVNPSQSFGRFRIASFGPIDLAILVRHIDSPVYAMRLS